MVKEVEHLFVCLNGHYISEYFMHICRKKIPTLKKCSKYVAFFKSWAPWLIAVIPATLVETERIKVPGQPEQKVHRPILTKKKLEGGVGWYAPVIPAMWETYIGGHSPGWSSHQCETLFEK
jgi:hypothetical protein